MKAPGVRRQGNDFVPLTPDAYRLTPNVKEDVHGRDC